MRSLRSFWASVLLLITLPAAVGCQAALGVDAELSVHFGLAAGCFLLRPFDFGTPGWLKWLGTLAALFLGMTFLLQFLAPVSGVEFINWVAFRVLGQWTESLSISLLMIWLTGVLITDSQGKTKTLGWICVPPAVAVMIYSYILTTLGTSISEQFAALKILLLLPFAWLLFESRKPRESDFLANTDG